MTSRNRLRRMATWSSAGRLSLTCVSVFPQNGHLINFFLAYSILFLLSHIYTHKLDLDRVLLEVLDGGVWAIFINTQKTVPGKYYYLGKLLRMQRAFLLLHHNIPLSSANRRLQSLSVGMPAKSGAYCTSACQDTPPDSH